MELKANTKIVIFSGPTLSKESIENKIDAIVLGPVSQGDVLKAYKKFNPTHMAIIDGYYENVPSVWHKEILYVMSQGVKLYGAASMGALRAAELHAFGMNGVGRIFDMYYSCEIEDDDEVAILHGPKDLGFPALTEAMVNLRITLQRAQIDNILTSNNVDDGIAFMKSLFYKERKRSALMDYLSDHLDDDNFNKFKIWIENNYINQKTADAHELIDFLKYTTKQDSEPQNINYTFYKTSFFKKMYATIEAGVDG
jgi:hypothetical protein